MSGTKWDVFHASDLEGGTGREHKKNIQDRDRPGPKSVSLFRARKRTQVDPLRGQKGKRNMTSMPRGSTLCDSARKFSRGAIPEKLFVWGLSPFLFCGRERVRRGFAARRSVRGLLWKRHHRVRTIKQKEKHCEKTAPELSSPPFPCFLVIH